VCSALPSDIQHCAGDLRTFTLLKVLKPSSALPTAEFTFVTTGLHSVNQTHCDFSHVLTIIMTAAMAMLTKAESVQHGHMVYAQKYVHMHV
jgi:hypothetical protein